jgi:triosephosphate isomerase
MTKPFFAGNWKMYQTVSSATSFLDALVKRQSVLERVDIGIFPPYPFLSLFQQKLKGTAFFYGGQTLHEEEQGAFTGEVSGKILKEFAATHVLVGHSERRQLFNERDDLLQKKVVAAQKVGLIPILCVGETLEERERGETRTRIEHQLEKGLALAASTKTFIQGEKEGPTLTLFEIAYEPVWAIGTGKVATPSQANEVHQWIREWLTRRFPLAKPRILYGGSVKPENVKGLMQEPFIDGALIGGASLDFATFEKIFEEGGSATSLKKLS